MANDGPLHPPLTPVKPVRTPQPVVRMLPRPPLQGHRARPSLQAAPPIPQEETES